MSLFLEKSNKIVQKFNTTNTHFIFCGIVAILLLITYFINYKESYETWIEIIGSFLQIAIPMYVIVPTLWKKDPKGAIQMLKLLALILGITWAFKLGLSHVFGIDDTRPRGGSMTFPSGHTAGAFSGAIFLSIRYGWKYALFFIPLATFVGYSRIYAMAHWLSDVIGAIILCTLAGIIVVKPFKRTELK